VKALTVRQPYASLLAIGAKRVETRSWASRGLAAGEWLAIHAAREWYPSGQEMARAEPFASALEHARASGFLATTDAGELPRSCILALARFACAIPGDRPEAAALSADERAFGIYGPGRWGWVFDAVRPLREPIPASGALGLWEWEAPPELERLLLPAI
jgi:hypothetical protein